MLHEEYLMKWSNSLGFKRQNYKSYMDEAANKGTYTHNSIEQYLKTGIEPDIESIPYLAKNAVYNAFNGFKEWWNTINKFNEIKILEIEKKLICQYFGGTLDCLLSINNKIWLIDFKTSNHMNYKYYLQLGAYAYMLKELFNIEIDGCLILKLNKNEIHYEEFVLDFTKEEEFEFFQQCIQEFMSLALAYYGRILIETRYKEIIKKKG